VGQLYKHKEDKEDVLYCVASCGFRSDITRTFRWTVETLVSFVEDALLRF